MLSLASWRFRDVAATRGGPVERLDLTELPLAAGRIFQVNAFLRPELVAWKSGGELFSDAAGSGTDASPLLARHKAISEAIERWAHMHVLRHGTPALHGFDVDPSSNGMAAFPGWHARQARRHALLEAAERFNLLQWWEGRLAARECHSPYPGVQAAILCSEAPGVTALLFRMSPDSVAGYGHAAGATFAEAARRALGELERHHAAVRILHAAPAGARTPLSDKAHPIEQRSYHFSTPEGHEHFLERLRSRTTRPLLRPRLVFDGEIRGPWSRFAHVWRVCYQPPTDRFLGPDPTFFYW